MFWSPYLVIWKLLLVNLNFQNGVWYGNLKDTLENWSDFRFFYKALMIKNSVTTGHNANLKAAYYTRNEKGARFKNLWPHI